MTSSLACQADIPVRGATRVFIISDLHLGGESAMMSRPSWLTKFIDFLPTRLAADETLELVINGDFIDFLAIAPFAAFTAAPAEAVHKLRSVTDAPSPFASVFAALGRHVAARHQLVIVVGNHDLELALPAVQDALRDCLCAPAGTLRFVDDGRAYRIGNALIEHGNTYDGANANDWNGVRHLVSAQSRASEPQAKVQVSAGSQIVHKIVNTLKQRYPFLPTIQPEGELLVLLMLQFEPELRSDIRKIAQLFKGQKLAKKLPKQGKTAIAAIGGVEAGLDAWLRELFATDYVLLNAPSQSISAGSNWIDSWHHSKKTSLSYMLEHHEPIPQERLNRIRLGMTRIVDADQTDLENGDTQQYGLEAERMLKTIPGLQAVVMGHTHLPRKLHYGQGVYINCGTWIDRFRVPREVLEDASCKELTSFLFQLLTPGGIKVMPPNFADLSVAADGTLRHAQLHAYEGALL